MINYEETIINNIMLKVQFYVQADFLNEVKNAIGSELHNYTISDKSYEVATQTERTNEYYLQLYLASKKIEGKSDGTIKRYKFVVDKLFMYIDKPVTEMTTNDIRFFMANYKKNNSNTTMDGMRRVLSAFFNWLEAEDYIVKSPVRKLAKIKWDTIKENPYSSADMEAMLNKTQHIRDKTILTMLYSTAIRVSELSKININDINYTNKTLHILDGKGGKDRIVPLESKTLYYLDEYIKWRDENEINEAALFVSRKKPYNRLKAESIRAMVVKMGELAKILHAHPHRYRVTRITDLLRRGMKLEEVQLIAGHENINTTASYNRCDLSLVDAEFRRKG